MNPKNGARTVDAKDVLLGQVAREVGIARSTAWARVLRGLIVAEWRGGRYIVDRAELDRQIELKQAAAGGR